MGKIDKRKILEDLGKALEKEEMEVRLVTKEESELEEDILLLELDEYGTEDEIAMGEFSFMDEEELPLIFQARIVLEEDLQEDNIADLCLAAALLNPSVPYGAFSYDLEEDQLIYKFCVPMSRTFDQEKCAEEAERCIALSITMAEHFAGDLLEVAHQ